MGYGGDSYTSPNRVRYTLSASIQDSAKPLFWLEFLESLLREPFQSLRLGQ